MEEEARSEATLRFVVNNFSKLTKTARGPPTFFRNLTWKIMVMPRIAHNHYRQPIRSLGFFLQCNGESDSTWSCYAEADLKLISQKEGVETFSRKIRHLFYSKENDWGFSKFLTWAEVLDPEKGYIKDDTIILEVSVTDALDHVRNTQDTTREVSLANEDGFHVLRGNKMPRRVNTASQNSEKDAAPSRNKKRTKIECGICYDSLNEILDSNRNLGSTVCGHLFCNTCMEASRRSSNLCPACRKPLDENQFHPLYF